MGSLVYEDYLYHHGVKGQRWGKRNGPPYPLYRKTSYYQKTGKRPPGYTGEKKGSIGSLNRKSNIRQKVEDSPAGKYNNAVKSAGKKWNKNMDPRIKNAVYGAGLAAGGVALGANAMAIKKGRDTLRRVAPRVMATEAKIVKGANKAVVNAITKNSNKVALAGAGLLIGGALAKTVYDSREAKKERIRRQQVYKNSRRHIGGFGSSSNNSSISELPSKYNKERETAKIEVRDGVQVRIQNKKLSDSENMDRVNPTFREKRTTGNEENCIACSVTMEARKRGLEYTARTDLAHDDDPDTCFNSVGKVYKNAKAISLGTDAKTGTKTFNSYYKSAEKLARRGANKELVRKLNETTSKMPKGSRGQICIMFDRYSGHSMYFTKEANGQVVFFDTQRNKKYTEAQLTSQLISSSSNVIFQRFDNCEINYKELMKYSR